MRSGAAAMLEFDFCDIANLILRRTWCESFVGMAELLQYLRFMAINCIIEYGSGYARLPEHNGV